MVVDDDGYIIKEMSYYYLLLVYLHDDLLSILVCCCNDAVVGVQRDEFIFHSSGDALKQVGENKFVLADDKTPSCSRTATTSTTIAAAGGGMMMLKRARFSVNHAFDSVFAAAVSSKEHFDQCKHSTRSSPLRWSYTMLLILISFCIDDHDRQHSVNNRFDDCRVLS